MSENVSINKDVLIYLLRHHKVFFPPNNLYNTDKAHIVIDDRFYQVEGNKKYLKKKIFNLIEESRPHLIEGKENNANAHKTIKHFLDKIIKINKQ